MGCDIHAYVETQDGAGHWRYVPDWEPFEDRNYGVFGFLADVRNYSAVPPISGLRELPEDLSPEVADAYERAYGHHSYSWLAAQELAEFDYDQPMNDRRVTRGIYGGVTGSPAEGRMTTYREFLGDKFMHEVERLKYMNFAAPTRVVFWFDN